MTDAFQSYEVEFCKEQNMINKTLMMLPNQPNGFILLMFRQKGIRNQQFENNVFRNRKDSKTYGIRVTKLLRIRIKS